MKTKKIAYIILLLAFTLSGCREIDIKTIINKDGSFTRVIKVKADSARVLDLDLPYPVDSTWTSELMRDTVDSTQFICIHKKHYSKDEVLQKEIDSDVSWWKSIDREIEISKSFRFFYSYIRYKEIYRAANPYTILDYKEYISDQDMRWIAGEIPLTAKDSSAQEEIEDKVHKFLEDALVEEFFLSMEEGLRKLDDDLLQSIDLRSYKDSVHEHGLDWLISENGQSPMNSIDKFADWTGEEKILQLHDIDPPIFEDFMRKFDLLDMLIGMESFTIAVEMPGLITETNSYMLMGNQVKWTIKDHTIFFEDYEMSVESRVVNYWAFVVSGIVVLLLLISLIVKLFR